MEECRRAKKAGIFPFKLKKQNEFGLGKQCNYKTLPHLTLDSRL